MGTALADTKTSFDPSYELMTASCGLTIFVFLGCSRALASTTYYWPLCSSNSWGRHFEPMSHSDLHATGRLTWKPHCDSPKGAMSAGGVRVTLGKGRRRGRGRGVFGRTELKGIEEAELRD